MSKASEAEAYKAAAIKHSEAVELANSLTRKVYEATTDRQRERVGKQLDRAMADLVVAKEKYDALFVQSQGNQCPPCPAGGAGGGLGAAPKFSSLITHLRRSKVVSLAQADTIIARMQNGAALEDAFYAQFGASGYREKLSRFEKEYPGSRRWDMATTGMAKRGVSANPYQRFLRQWGGSTSAVAVAGEWVDTNYYLQLSDGGNVVIEHLGAAAGEDQGLWRIATYGPGNEMEGAAQSANLADMYQLVKQAVQRHGVDVARAPRR